MIADSRTASRPFVFRHPLFGMRGPHVAREQIETCARLCQMLFLV